MRNDVLLCFAALEVIAREAPAVNERGQGGDIRARIFAPLSETPNAEERAIREGAVFLLDSVRARR